MVPKWAYTLTCHVLTPLHPTQESTLKKFKEAATTRGRHAVSGWEAVAEDNELQTAGKMR